MNFVILLALHNISTENIWIIVWLVVNILEIRSLIIALDVLKHIAEKRNMIYKQNENENKKK